MLTQGELRNQIEYNELTGLWRWRYPYGIQKKNSGWFAGTPDSDGYLRVFIDGKAYSGHVLAWLYVYGEYRLHLDHENRIKSDNRINNLRPSNKSNNAINSKIRSTNTSGQTGILFRSDRPKKPWLAFIEKHGVKIRKSFETKEEAIKWREELQEKLFGEFVPKVVVSNSK